MALIDDLTLGRFVAGDSLLHRLDPRLKLCALPLLVIAVFSGYGWLRLAVLGGAALLLVLVSGIGWRFWWRGVRVLRWLLLATVLLYLFFSPGRTLWGVTWLSRDGLVAGGMVCCRLVLAVLFSSLLTLTTSPVALAGAFAALLKPLERCGLPVREWTRLLQLVLYFIPIFREEALAMHGERQAAGEPAASQSLLQRARALGQLLMPLLLRLVDRADALAKAEAAGEDLIGAPEPLPPLLGTGPANLLALVAGVAGLVGIFGFLR